jgi:hypothetical protein
VEFLAKKENQPRLKNKTLIFEYRPGTPVPDEVLQDEAEDRLIFGDDDDDIDFVPPVENEDDTDDDASVYSEMDENEVNDLHDAELEEDNVPAPPLTSNDLHTIDDLEDLIGAATDNSTRIQNETPPPTTPREQVVVEEVEEQEEEEMETIEEQEEDEEYIPPITTENVNAEENEAAPRYALRDRNTINAPSFNEDFSNPENSKSYSTSVQLFQTISFSTIVFNADIFVPPGSSNSTFFHHSEYFLAFYMKNHGNTSLHE